MSERRAPAAYRLLLRLFPRAFRDRFAADMEAVFAERLRDAGRSRRARWGVWVPGVSDVVTQAFAELIAHSRPFPARRLIVESMIQDVRFAVRGLARSRGFAAVAIATLALGVGANAAVFSVVNALLLRPLPYSQPERLVSVWPETVFNRPLVDRVAESVPALESMSGVSEFNLTASGDGEPEEVAALFVSPNHFDVLGVRPLFGRGFAPEEGEPGQGDVVVLSHDFWQARYGGDPSILGRRIQLSGPAHETHEVIGVMGRGHRPVVGDPAAWVPQERPQGFTVATDYAWWVSLRIGRLAPGFTREQAQAQLRAVTPELRAEVPQTINEDEAHFASVVSLRDAAAGPLRGALWMLLGAVGLVLLIACMNLANLLLARGEGRAQELALRRALGAGGTRLARQLLTEALVLALAGGAAGLLVAHLLLGVIVAQAPPDLAEIGAVRLDGAVLTFALLVSCGAALVFGAVPAMRARRSEDGAIVRQGAKGSVGIAGHGFVSKALVAAEVGLAVVLVVGSGLMLRTLDRLHRVDPGFRAEGVLVLRPNPSAARHPGGIGYQRFYADVLERVRELPDVESAAGIQIRPVTTDQWTYPVFPDDHVVPAGASPPSHHFRLVTPGYFETLRIPSLAGRTVEEADHAEAPAVLVINRAFAERYWPGRDPIGKEVRFFAEAGVARRIVGVVGDVRQRALDLPPEPEMYIPHSQVPWQVSLWLMVRARDGDAARLAPLVREAVWSIDRETPVAQMEPLANVVGRSAALTRFLTLALGFFGFLALVLGAIGVYGVTAYTVARRLPEFGVRLVLGATPRDVLGSALARGSIPVAIGIVLGTIAALSLTTVLRSRLFEVGPRDPVTFVAVIGLLAVVALAALLLPALRATRADPIAALRQE